MSQHGVLGVLLMGALLGVASGARADLGHDVDALLSAWQREGHVERLEPQLHERGNSRHLALPRRSTRARGGGCTTVAILGVPASSFIVRFEPAQADAPPAPPIRSQAGLIEITRCERERKTLRNIVLDMRSPRGVIETVVLSSDAPPLEAYAALPQRLPGPTAPNVDAGRAPSTGEVVPRAKALVARLTQRGAEQVDHGLLRGDLDGAGITAVEFEAGCHELTMMTVPAPSDAPRGVDLDLDLVWPSGEVAESDRTDAPDAVVHLCVAQPRRLVLRFGGALPRSPVLFVHARWPLPPQLDHLHGSRPEVRARFAHVLRENHLKLPDAPPVEQSLGIGGLTAIPIEVEPGACYVLAVAIQRGHAAGIGAAAAIGADRVQNNSGSGGQATALAFCVRSSRHALLEVETQGGGGLAWYLALWQNGRIRPGDLGE